MVVLFTPTASAQATAQVTAAKVEVVSGNGQMICRHCFGSTFTFFYPMVVKVTDASGNPIAGKTVNWQLFASPLTDYDAVTYTDSNGLSISRIFAPAFEQPAGATQPPFQQFSISATVDGASTTFTETLALVIPSSTGNAQQIFSSLDTPFGTVLTGPAGSKGTSPIQVHINGAAVPNVSVRILSPVSPDPTTPLPSASCATGPGADPGSVLTDANGKATCYPVFGKPFFPPGAVSVSGPITVLVGGLDPAQFDYSVFPNVTQPLTDPVSFHEYHNWIQLVVTPVIPGRVVVVSGNNQSVDPGKSSQLLVVQVTDPSGAVNIGNTKVDWIVSPAGAATASPSQSTTDSLGQTQTTIIFSPNASGQITVRAALNDSRYSGISTNFTLSTRVLISSLIKVSGDLQTVQAGQNFGLPLVVRVIGTNGQPLSNQPISFVLKGAATLSDLSVLTGPNGQAQITVTAGATPGTVTINAFIGDISITQPFTLTVIPPGPILSSGSFLNAGGGARIGALSPCSLVTVTAPGLAPNVQGLVLNTTAFGPWATTLASDTVTVNSVAAPIYSVGNVNGVEQITFQVPCETAPGSSVPITISVGGGIGTVNVPVQAASPGIFETVMSDGARRAVAIRPDGAFVSLQNPARPGDIIRVFVTGMGAAAPAIVTGALPFAGADSLVLGQVIVGVQNAGARVVTARVSPNLIGVYELDFQVPSDAPSSNDVVFSVAVNAPGDNQTRFSNASKLPILQ